MKKIRIGYPCINRSIQCRGNKSFRLSSYSKELLIKTIDNNLFCLEQILDYNIKQNLLFFRITSDLIPFASHAVNTFQWRIKFKTIFRQIGRKILKNNIRISMHPDQFVLINSPQERIVQKNVQDLSWHADVLDLMGLDQTAKIQIHVGGIYQNKKQSISRFIKNYSFLPKKIKNRLVIENDDRLYSLKDCLYIHHQTGIPIVFDSFHHELFNNHESFKKAIQLAYKTWSKKDGPLMVDYSSQQKTGRKGKHTDTINISHFAKFISYLPNKPIDIMLEIKDKEQSALKAQCFLSQINK